MINVMSTRKPSLANRWYCPDELLEHAAALEAALPVKMTVWKTIKALFDLATIALAGYAIYSGLDPFLAVVGAAVITQGPDLLEWWLVNNDYYDFRERQEDED